MSLLSPRPCTGVSAPWPPAPLAPLVSAGLLSLQRDLLKLCAPLERAVAEWMAQFDTQARITKSIEATMPRWRTLIEAQAAMERRRNRADAESQLANCAALHATTAAESSTATVAAASSSSSSAASSATDDDDCFFAAAQPLHSSFSAAPSSAPGTAAHSDASDPDAALLASVGVLGCLPGHVAKLALQQQRQVEIASNLLTNMHHDLSSSFTHLCVSFDSVQDLFAQNKKLFSPSQLALWCSSASSGTAAAAAGSAGSVEKGSAHKKSADKKKGAGAGGKAAESSDPPANSVLNIMRRLEAIEAVVAQQFDAHGIAWMELQRALREAANPRDAAAQFQLSRGEQPSPDVPADDEREPPSTPTSVSSSSSILSPSKSSSRPAASSSLAAPRFSGLAAWFRVPHPATLDAWNARHALVDPRIAWLGEQWHLLKGKTPRDMLDEAVWEARTDDDDEGQ